MVKPALAKFAVPHSEETKLPGHYDSTFRQWLSSSGIPLINTVSELPELRTKTDTLRERDDTNNYLFELLTKTNTIRERDDQ